jgi:peptidyl-prolyl cis-trans isomerase D
MVKEFNDFVFGSKVGAIDLIETAFGYHIVKVDDKKDTYQIATLARSLAPSESTINTNFKNATSFEMAVSEDKNKFGGIAKESDYQVRTVSKIEALEENLPGLGAQRSVVQWAFNDNTTIGDIKKFDLGTGYAVVQLTAIYNEGISSVADASITAIPAIRKEKKAAQLKAQYAGKSMDEIATTSGVAVATASAVSISNPVIPGAGREAYIIGKAFALDQGVESGLLEGNDGVYIIKVTEKTSADEMDSYAAYAGSLESQRRSVAPYTIFTALKKAADIEDNRANFY